MIGRFQLALGSNELTSGMASTDFTSDGALGTSTTGVNPFSTPGVINSIAAPTNLSPNVLNNVIASCEDSQSVAAYNRTFIDASGNYYTLNGTTVTKTNTATTNAAYYTASLTDMVSYNFNTYVTTSNGDIDLWATSGTPALTNSWWITTKAQTAMSSSAPHPMIVAAETGVLYIADRNKIHGVNSSGTIDTFFPALPYTINTNETVYAFGIDPFTGLILISTQTILNISGNQSSKFYIYLWDGISANFARKIPVDDLVSAFQNVEGTVYCTIGSNLGMWTGSGVAFLRKLSASPYTGNFVYKHNICSTRNILHINEGKNILSYGTVVAGAKKGFFHTASTNTTYSGSAVFPIGDYKIGVADGNTGLYSFDYASTSSGTSSIYTNWIWFPRPVFIRRIRIITSGVTTTSGIGDVNIYDERGTTYSTNQFVVLAANSPKNVFDFDYTNAKVMGLQAKINIDTQAFGIYQVIIYYDVAE